MIAKIDPHVHTWHSNSDADWFLPFLKCPECFTPPEEIYHICIKRGMTHVCTTDHNNINAGLELAAKYNNIIIGEEISAYFPDEEVKLHVPVIGITEQNHRDITELRYNIYELAKYLHQNRIPHYVAHPLFNYDMGALKIDHLEKLALLFKGFEVINGGRGQYSNQLAYQYFSSLTKEKIEQFANKHNLAPLGEQPWKKHLYAGSDDHAGIYPGTNYMQIKCPDTRPESIVKAMYRGDMQPFGSSGTITSMGVQIFGVAYKFYKKQRHQQRNKEFFVLLDSIFEQHTRTTFTPKDKMALVLKRILFNGNETPLHEIYDIIKKQSPDDELFKVGFQSRELYNKQILNLTSNIWDKLLVSVLKKKFDWHYLFTIGSLFLSPYLLSTNAHSSENRLRNEIERTLGKTRPPRIAWFTDGLSRIDGVSRMIQLFMDQLEKSGKEVHLIVSESTFQKNKNIVNFKPIHNLKLPWYENISINIPSVLKVLDFIEKNQFTHIIISSPGPVGLLGLLIGKLMKLPIVGIHHTDWIRFSIEVTKDVEAGEIFRMVQSIFYRQMRKVFARSRSYLNDVKQLGVNPKNIDILPSWTDLHLFHPTKRIPNLYGDHSMKLLYVGRLSKEKNLHRLIKIYEKAKQNHPNIKLIVVGDGPYKRELKNQAANLKDLIFTGVLKGEQLAKAYASCDLFIFPAKYETFGNVVLEAQASGLPAVVSNSGGPQEIIIPDETGYICDPDNIVQFTHAITRLHDDHALLEKMRKAARKNAETRFNPQTIIDNFYKSIIAT